MAPKGTTNVPANNNNKQPKSAKQTTNTITSTTTSKTTNKTSAGNSNVEHTEKKGTKDVGKSITNNNTEKKDPTTKVVANATTTIAVLPTPTSNNTRKEDKSQQIALESTTINTMVSAVDETNIKVVVRSRPLNQREISLKSTSCLSIAKSEGKIKLVRKDKEDKEFFFDGVFDDSSSQNEIYKSTGAMVLERFILGYNACIFAYGQTSSGKTYTMEGVKGNQQEEGIMTRFVRELFEYVKKEQKKTDITIKASYIEIYNETIQDLLHNRTEKLKYDVREDKVKGIMVTNIIERPIGSEEELNDLLDEGSSRRTTGETKMNQFSSRSHSVLTIYMDQVDKGDEDGLSLRSNKISLVDLAGSERASSTEATGDRLKEGANINLSLSNLGNVINALVKKTNFVPYRNSILTRLLKDSIGGNAFCVMISCVSAADVNSEETLSTLYFSDRAKQIKNKLRVSRGDPRLEKIAELLENEKKLKARIEELEKQLANCQQGVGGGKKGCCCTIM